MKCGFSWLPSFGVRWAESSSKEILRPFFTSSFSPPFPIFYNKYVWCIQKNIGRIWPPSRNSMDPHGLTAAGCTCDDWQSRRSECHQPLPNSTYFWDNCTYNSRKSRNLENGVHQQFTVNTRWKDWYKLTISKCSLIIIEVNLSNQD